MSTHPLLLRKRNLINLSRLRTNNTKLLLGILIATSPFSYAVSTADIETVVVTATREAQPLVDVAGSMTVIDNDTLQMIGQTHVQETLVRVAGANLARGNGQEYLPALRSPVLTGAGACGGLLTALDGVPLRAAGFCNINELFDVNTEQAARIEVIRGPGSALFGSNAMHGVMNIISPSASASPGLQLGIEAGPHDYSRMMFSGSTIAEEHAYRADLVLTHDGGYRDDSGFDQQKLSLRHDFQQGSLTVNSTFALSNLNQETAGYISGSESYKDSQLKDSNPNPEAFRDVWSARFATRIEYIMDERQHFSMTPYLRYTKMDLLQHFLPGDPLEENGQKSLGLQSAYYRDIGENWNVIAGVDIEFTDGYLKQSQDAPTMGSAFLQATIPIGKHYDYQIDARMIAPYIHTTWVVTPALEMTFGFRYEMMDYDYDNKMVDGRTDEAGNTCGFGGCRYTRPGDRHDSFENGSPKLAVLYHLNDTHRLYANVSNGFRAPQGAELYRLQRAQVVAELDSEEVNSFEVGLRGSGDQGRYDLALYAMRKDNVIFRDSDFFNVSNGKTEHLGVEVQFNYSLNAHWDVGMAGSYARHTYNSDQVVGGININGNEVDTAPKHFGSAQLGWNVTPSTRAELEWVHMGKYFTDPENQHSYEGHDIVNVRTRWNLASAWILSVRLMNLANSDYAERADFTNFSGDRYFPGEPRSLYLEVERRW